MSKRIAVFLSSHENLSPTFKETAEAVGQWIGQNGHTLVYGGARKGLMETLAQATRKHGGMIIGVVPQILVDKNLVSDTLDVTFHCVDLNDRKATMVRESDVFLALPGGIGTLDEIFTVMSANTIGIHRKHVILYNADGCWNTTILALEDLRQQKLISQETLSLLHVVQSVKELQETICTAID